MRRRRATLIAAVFAVTFGAAQAQTMDDARAAQRAGDVAGAVTILQDLLAEGDATAMVPLGHFVAQGADTPVDPEEERRLFRAAAEAGEPWGWYVLAVMLLHGEGGTRDVEGSVDLFRAAAQAGLPAGRYQVGMSSATGRGVEINRCRAYREFSAAAGAGLREARVAVADALVAGEGTTADPALVRRIYRKLRNEAETWPAPEGTRERAFLLRKISALDDLPESRTSFVRTPFETPRDGETTAQARAPDALTTAMRAEAAVLRERLAVALAEAYAEGSPEGPLRCTPGAPPIGAIVEADHSGFVYVTLAARPFGARITLSAGEPSSIWRDLAPPRDEAKRIAAMQMKDRATLLVLDRSGDRLGEGWPFAKEYEIVSLAMNGSRTLDDECPGSSERDAMGEAQCDAMAASSWDALYRAIMNDRGPFELVLTLSDDGSGDPVWRQELHLMPSSVYRAAYAAVREDGVTGRFHLAPCD